MMGMYRISDLNIEINTHAQTLLDALKPYEISDDIEPNISLSMTDDRLIELMEENEGYTADVVETTYFATLYCWALFDFNGFPIRATAVENDGKCVLFAHPANEDLDLGIFLPEDKVFTYKFPGIRFEGDECMVFDTPFGLSGSRAKQGKRLELSSIVFYDNRFSTLKKLEAKDFVPLFMRAVAQNIRHERTKHTLFLLERLMHMVDFYGVGSLSDIDFILDRV